MSMTSRSRHTDDTALARQDLRKGRIDDAQVFLLRLERQDGPRLTYEKAKTITDWLESLREGVTINGIVSDATVADYIASTCKHWDQTRKLHRSWAWKCGRKATHGGYFAYLPNGFFNTVMVLSGHKRIVLRGSVYNTALVRGVMEANPNRPGVPHDWPAHLWPDLSPWYQGGEPHTQFYYGPSGRALLRMYNTHWRSWDGLVIER